MTAFPKPEKPDSLAKDLQTLRAFGKPRCRTCGGAWARHKENARGFKEAMKAGECEKYQPKRPPPKNKLPRGHRKSDLGKAKRTLWDDWFAPYIKARDGNACFTCDRVVTGVELQAGHMFPGRTGALLFDPLVVKSQCVFCNKGKRGNTAVFVARYIAKHGSVQFEVVVARTSRDMQWRTHEIRELIEALKRDRDEPGYYESFYEARYGLTKEAV